MSEVYTSDNHEDDELMHRSKKIVVEGLGEVDLWPIPKDAQILSVSHSELKGIEPIVVCVYIEETFPS